MSATVNQIVAAIASNIPEYAAEDWDNVGLQVGAATAPVESVLVCLEVNDGVIDEAIERQCNMIISHHPLIFRPLKTLCEANLKGRLVSRLIKSDIALYVMHTNYDHYEFGLSDLLAKALSLQDVAPLIEVMPQYDEPFALGKRGKLKAPLSAEAFAAHLKASLSLQSVRLAGDMTKTISTVAVVSGAGMDFIGDVARIGVDAYVTGDAKYHEVVESLHYGLLLADVGHFESEVIFASGFAKQLTEIAKRQGLDIIVSAAQSEVAPFKYY